MSGGVAALAESLADRGLPALLIELHGTAQSSGDLSSADIGARWRDDIRAAVRHLRDAGFAQLIVVGVRVGALLALDALRDEPLLGVVAWSPVVSGRQHVRELKVLQQSAGHAPHDSARSGLSIGGFDLPDAVLAHLSGLDLARIGRRAGARLLLLDSAARLDTDAPKRLAELGAEVETRASDEVETWLFGASDQPLLPRADIGTVTRWCERLHESFGEGLAGPAARPTFADSIAFAHRGERIRETSIEIAPLGLAAILSEPVAAPASGAMRLLMSSVGPGRTFTDFARDEASCGRACLRFDFAGFGSSHWRALAQGGELYSDSGSDDVNAALEHLRRNGHERVVMLGFCAGAWSMLQAGARPGVVAAAAINVALYWQPTAAPDARAGIARRAIAAWLPALARWRAFRRVVARLSPYSMTKRRPVEWVEVLCASDVDVLLAYAESDPGLEYLNRQFHNGLRASLRRGRLSLKVYEGLGHLAEGSAARSQVFDDVAAFFAQIDRRADSPQALSQQGQQKMARSC